MMIRRRSFLVAAVSVGFLPQRLIATPLQQMLLAGGVSVPAAWSSITSLGASTSAAARGGSTNSGVAVNGGETIPYVNAVLLTTSQWNGASWSSSGSMTSKHSESGGNGTLTDLFVASGLSDLGPTSTQITDKYNGVSWASGGNTPAVQRNISGSGCGSPSAGLIFGGTNNTGTITAATNSYNGASWTAGGNLPSNTTFNVGAGSVTSALSAMGSTTGANSSGGTSVSNTYNGSTWSGGATAGASTLRVTGCGVASTDIVMAGGYNGITSCQKYNGSAFSAGASLNLGRMEAAISGNGSSAVAAGGNTSSGNNSTAERYQ